MGAVPLRCRCGATAQAIQAMAVSATSAGSACCFNPPETRFFCAKNTAPETYSSPDAVLFLLLSYWQASLILEPFLSSPCSWQLARRRRGKERKEPGLEKLVGPRRDGVGLTSFSNLGACFFPFCAAPGHRQCKERDGKDRKGTRTRKWRWSQEGWFEAGKPF